jgi:hypothetical protein
MPATANATRIRFDVVFKCLLRETLLTPKHTQTSPHSHASAATAARLRVRAYVKRCMPAPNHWLIRGGAPIDLRLAE